MKTPVDMFVVGSMGVDSRGYRVGKEGDLTGIDFILGNMGRSIKYIVTLVHDCQVFEEIPPSIFSMHDLPVDIIITPSRVIRVEKKLNKPDNINWSILKYDLKNRIPLLEGVGAEDLLKVKKLNEGVCLGMVKPKATEGECEEIATRPMLVTNKDKRNQMTMASKFKFDNIPSAVGYQELKQMLRGRKIVAGFCVITLRAGSAVVAFKEISRVVREKLKGFEFWSSKIKMQEVGVEVGANPNVKSDVAQKRKGVEKIRHKIMLETFEKLRVQNNCCGVFMGKLPFGTTENELREALEAQNLIPVTLDMGHRNRFAIAFFVEELEVLLSLLGAMLLQGKEILVEEYDPHKREGLGEGEVESSTDGTRVEGN